MGEHVRVCYPREECLMKWGFPFFLTSNYVNHLGSLVEYTWKKKNVAIIRMGVWFSYFNFEIESSRKLNGTSDNFFVLYWELGFGKFSIMWN